MKNNIKKVVLFCTSILPLFSISLTSCGNDEEKSVEIVEREINPEIRKDMNGEPDKEIKISYTLAGYGDAWIKAAVAQFNTIFEGYGYKAVIGRSDANFTTDNVVSEIKYPEENEYDLYFTISENIISTLIDASYSVLRSRNDTLLADLTDLYESHPFDLGGYDEDYTIGEAIDDTTKLHCSYTTSPDSKWYNKPYGLSWTRGIAGFTMNTAVLRQCGYEEAPRTTDEFFKMFDEIKGKNLVSSVSGQPIYPITWAGANAAGYYEYVTLTWLAQWKGYQGYLDFFSLTPETGDTLTNGYDVYEDKGIEYSFDALYRTVNQNNASNGTVTTIDHLQSEGALADGEALFCTTGDWCYNELIGCEYLDEELNDIEMFPVPVLSQLADKVGLPGADAAAKDELLSLIIKDVDENMAAADIVSDVNSKKSVTVTEDQVNRIAEARGMYFDMGTNHNVIIPSYSDNVDGAKLFLRFIFSKDFNDNVYSKNAHAVNANIHSEPQTSNYLKSLARITHKDCAQSVGRPDKISQIRMNGGINFVFEPYAYWGDIVKGMAIEKEGYEANTVYEKVKSAMKNNWSTILTAAGMDEE